MSNVDLRVNFTVDVKARPPHTVLRIWLQVRRMRSCASRTSPAHRCTYPSSGGADQEVYDLIQGSRKNVDSSRSLVMLAPTIHALYDSWALSFYPLLVSPERELWVVHYFCPPEGDAPHEIADRLLHGRVTEVSTPGDKGYRPDWRLTRWHYAQAARFHFGPENMQAPSPSPKS